MLKAFRKLWNDDRGNILIIAGAALPMLVGAAGLATDTIQWTLWKRELQRAADSGAIAGVYDRNTKGNTDATEEAVLHDLDLNHHTGIDWVNDPVVTFPADTAEMQNQVRVVLTVRKTLPFSSMFMSAAPIIEAGATAASVPGGETYCVIALEKKAVVGLEIAGSSHLDMGACSLISNSTHPDKAASNGSNSATGGQGSTVVANSLAAAGGVLNSNSWNIKNYDPNSTPADDPYEDLPVPSTCDKNITLDGGDVDRTAVDTDPTEVVCINNLKKQGNKWIPSGLTVTGDVKLGSATYVLNGGDLTMNSTGSELSCPSCTIILTDFADPDNTGNIKLTGGHLDLTAPSTGDYAGVVLYQDREADDDGKEGANHINGNSNGGTVGAIYTPGRSLLYNGGGNTTAVCMQVISLRVKFSGNSLIQVPTDTDCPNAPDTSGGRRVRLVA